MLTVLPNTFEIDLLIADRRSRRPPDRAHPFPDVRSFACVPDEQALRER